MSTGAGLLASAAGYLLAAFLAASRVDDEDPHLGWLAFYCVALAATVVLAIGAMAQAMRQL